MQWQLEESMKARLFGSTSYYEVLQQYGVPKSIIRRWMKKLPKQLVILTLKEVKDTVKNRKVRRDTLKEAIHGLAQGGKCRRPTLLTRDKEALLFAKSEIEGAHGFPVCRLEVGQHLNEVGMSLGSRKYDTKQDS